MDKKELAEFLRRRRELLRPGDVGLVEGRRRRTQGLRREEVAALAGMSTDYYARLEQQRGPQPSVQIATALARALRLTLDERDHLFSLIGHNAPSRFHRGEHVDPTLLTLLDRLTDSPALVVSDMCDTLVQNPLATALLGDQTSYTGLARSTYYRWFTDPAERLLYPEEDWPQLSQMQAARLRTACTAADPDPRAAQVVAELAKRSTEFVEVWDRHDVTQCHGESKRIIHPELGLIEVDALALFTENRSQLLLVMTARPGTESQSKLEMLAVIGNQQLTSPLRG